MRTMLILNHRYRLLISLFASVLVLALWLPARAVPSSIIRNSPLVAQDASLQDRFGQLWQNFFPDDRPPGRRTGGGRGNGFCAVAHGEKDAIVWSGPTFVWQGAVTSIELHPSSSSTQRQPALAQLRLNNLIDSSAGLHQVTYVGRDLQPGQRYTWTVTPQNEQSLSFDFQLLPEARRDQINAALQSLNAQTKATGGNAETIALRQANYLAKQQLWSDFWHVILSVPEPSPQLKTLQQETANWVCNP